MAVMLTSAELASHLGVEAAVAARLLAVASTIVERHAPQAPPAVADEATLRLAGWLLDAPSAGVRSERVGDVVTSYVVPGRASPLLASGAGALLAEYRVRRAGAIR